jgi:hypothetical protein
VGVVLLLPVAARAQAASQENVGGAVAFDIEWNHVALSVQIIADPI